MESNNIYVTKKEFYSTITGILALVLVIVTFSNDAYSNDAKENSWIKYILILMVGVNFIFFFYKTLREKSKTKSFSQADK